MTDAKRVVQLIREEGHRALAVIAENADVPLDMYMVNMERIDTGRPMLLQDLVVSGGDLTGLWLRWACFRGSKFNGVTFDRCDMQGVDVNSCSFEKCSMQSVHFDSADMVNSLFIECDMKLSNFRDALLSSASLTGCTLRSARFGRAQMEGVWLAACDLTNAMLSAAEGISSADFTGSKRGPRNRPIPGWKLSEGGKLYR